MRFRFFTSTPLGIRRGSGTFVGIRTLVRGLEQAGVAIETIAPTWHLPIYTLERLVFNETLRLRSARGADLTVGFDLDGYAVAGRGGVPHIAALKGVIADEARFESGATRATMQVQAAFERRHVHRASLVVAPSRYSAERARELYRLDRLPSVIPEGIHLPAWRALLRDNPAQPDPARFTVLCVARFYPRKRLHLLLGAAARLRGDIPGLRVRIVGDGPRAGELREIRRRHGLENTVQLLGSVSLTQLAAEYNGCDVFCLPSVQEAFGIVFLEAMASGKPVVAARAAAMPEVAPQACFAEPGDDQSLAAAIDRVYRDPALRAAMAAEGKRRVEMFDAPRVACLFLAEARRLLA